MKRILSLALMVIVAFGAIGVASHPATAAPSTRPATLMPADVTFYAELNTSNLTSAVDLFFKLFGKSGIPITEDQLYSQADKALTQVLGRPATFKGDVLNWLGDRAAIGVEITDTLLQSPASNAHFPALAILNVKDDTAADTFLADLFTSVGKHGLSFTQTTDQIGGNTATLYTNAALKLSVARIPGELAVGSDDAIATMIDTLKNNKPTLGADAKFRRTIALLTQDSGLVAYVGGRALQYSVALAQAAIVKRFPAPSLNLSGPDPTEAAASLTFLGNLYKAYDGTALALRGSSRTLAFDLATSIDPNALKNVSGAFGLSAADPGSSALSGKLAGQIPGKVATVFEAANLARDYRLFRDTLQALDKSPGLSPTQKERLDQTIAGFDQFEQGLKDGLDLDINQDLLSWLGGDFAVYSILDPNSELALASNGSFPFDSALIVAASDADKARTFVDKLNAGVALNFNLHPKAAGKDLYILPVSPRLTVGYGVVDNSFVLTSGGALPTVAGAIGGADVLADRGAWHSAASQLPQNVLALAYLDLTPFQPYIAQLPNAHNPGAQGLAALLNLTQSAVIYSVAPGPGQSVLTFALILK
ncbi:MAG: DUF3352 domain-containing protein [Aggregatilineales bacterium]